MRCMKWGGWAMVFVFLALAPTAPAVLPAVPTNIGWGRDVVDWWATHPFNPDARTFDIQIKHPQPTRTLSPGADIAAAISNLPNTGGTLMLMPGKYNGFTVIRRGNIHLLAASGVTVTGRVTFAGTPLGYHDFCVAIRVTHPKEAVDDFLHRKTRNIVLENITFDGGGTESAATAFNCVDGVLIKGCRYQNFKRPAQVHHNGISYAAMGANNVWYYDCEFYGMPGPGNAMPYAVYHDGLFGGGLINCRVKNSNFSGAAFLFMCNDDFTEDLNKDGRFDDNEIRISRYLVFQGNTLPALPSGMLLSCAQSLFLNNKATGKIGTFFRFNPKTSLIYPNNTYNYCSNRVIGNVMRDGQYLVHLTSNEDYCPPGQSNKAWVSQIKVLGNRSSAIQKMLHISGAEVGGPNIECGNCLNDPACKPDPLCDRRPAK